MSIFIAKDLLKILGINFLASGSTVGAGIIGHHLLTNKSEDEKIGIIKIEECNSCKRLRQQEEEMKKFKSRKILRRNKRHAQQSKQSTH